MRNVRNIDELRKQYQTLEEVSSHIPEFILKGFDTLDVLDDVRDNDIEEMVKGADGTVLRVYMRHYLCVLKFPYYNTDVYTSLFERLLDEVHEYTQRAVEKLTKDEEED